MGSSTVTRLVLVMGVLCLGDARKQVAEPAAMEPPQEIVRELKTELRANRTASKDTVPVEKAPVKKASGLARLLKDASETDAGAETPVAQKATPVPEKKSDESIVPHKAFWAQRAEQDEAEKAAAQPVKVAEMPKKAPEGSLKDLVDKTKAVAKTDAADKAAMKAAEFQKAKADFAAKKAKILAREQKQPAKPAVKNATGMTKDTAQQRWLEKWAALHAKRTPKTHKAAAFLEKKPKARKGSYERHITAKELKEQKEFDAQASRCVTDGNECWQAYNGCAEDFCRTFMFTMNKAECFQKALVAYHRVANADKETKARIAKACPEPMNR